MVFGSDGNEDICVGLYFRKEDVLSCVNVFKEMSCEARGKVFSGICLTERYLHRKYSNPFFNKVMIFNCYSVVWRTGDLTTRTMYPYAT